MGVVETVGLDRFPKQGSNVGAHVSVCFHYDTSRQVPGILIRNDCEAPWRTTILLLDGRVVEATECQYQIRNDRPTRELLIELAFAWYRQFQYSVDQGGVFSQRVLDDRR